MDSLMYLTILKNVKDYVKRFLNALVGAGIQRKIQKMKWPGHAG